MTSGMTNLTGTTPVSTLNATPGLSLDVLYSCPGKCMLRTTTGGLTVGTGPHSILTLLMSLITAVLRLSS